MYRIMMVISILVRQFWLPNPFECFGNWAFVINIVAEPIMHIAAYLLVGTIYRTGSFPALGSLLYILAYAAITFILWIMGIFSFAWWWVLLIVAAMAGLSLLINRFWE